MPLWMMHLPVLSTRHMPGPLALAKLRDTSDLSVAEYAEGGFVALPTLAECQGELAWLHPIVAWSAPQLFDWIRFDSIGQTIDTLPKYKW